MTRRKKKNILNDIAAFKITGLHEDNKIHEDEDEVGSCDDDFTLFGDDRHEYLLVDENIIKYKGRAVYFIQYIISKEKPIKHGIKVFVK